MKMKAMAIAVALSLTPNLAFAAGWLLVLRTSDSAGNAIAIVQNPYPTKQACTQAGNISKGGLFGNFFVCIPAP